MRPIQRTGIIATHIPACRQGRPTQGRPQAGLEQHEKA
jgi:hypothetical protein